MKRLRSSSSSTSPAPSPRAPPISHKKKSCYLEGSLALYEPDKEQIIRQYEAGKSLASRSQRSHDIGSKEDADEGGTVRYKDMTLETPNYTSGGYLKRKAGIEYVFEHLLGSPPEDQWGGSDGTVANIMFRLSIPKNSYRQVQKILRDFVHPEEKVETRGRKAVISKALPWCCFKNIKR